MTDAFDLAGCPEVLEHVADRPRLLHGLTTASRMYLLLSFPVGRMHGFETSKGHRRNFSRGEVEGFL